MKTKINIPLLLLCIIGAISIHQQFIINKYHESVVIIKTQNEVKDSLINELIIIAKQKDSIIRKELENE